MLESSDILGAALLDFQKTGTGHRLIAHTSYGPDETYFLDYFFRDIDRMPDLEHYALSLCSGKILEIGAGAGSHALLLQQDEKDIVAMDTSAGCVNVMVMRGVLKVQHMDVFNLSAGGYNTLLLLMNGIGIVKNLKGLVRFLEKAEDITSSHAQIIFDSTDVSYALHEDSRESGRYLGEMKYQFDYRGVKGPWFDWLYIDQAHLFEICDKTHWLPTILFEEGKGHFLARLLKKY
jgi:hypothetical protein